MCCGLSQEDNIADYVESQDWPGLEIVHDLPGRGRGVKATCTLQPTQVVCDYHGELLSHKDGKERYEASGENEMGYMFSFRHNGSSYWVDATKELPGPGRLINHSRCHANVSTSSVFHHVVFVSCLLYPSSLRQR